MIFCFFFNYKNSLRNLSKTRYSLHKTTFNFFLDRIRTHMISDKQDAIQLLNTAVIKSKEKRINSTYEERLAKICNSPVMNALLVAIDHLSDTQKISKDHASVQLIETLRELDSIWNDYVVMEGISKVKELLKNNHH